MFLKRWECTENALVAFVKEVGDRRPGTEIIQIFV